MAKEPEGAPEGMEEVPLRHGAYFEGDYEFYWLGRQVGPDEFNYNLRRMAGALKGEIEAMAHGMDMGAYLGEANKVLAKLETVEAILELPLCSKCRGIIEYGKSGEAPGVQGMPPPEP